MLATPDHVIISRNIIWNRLKIYIITRNTVKVFLSLSATEFTGKHDNMLRQIHKLAIKYKLKRGHVQNLIYHKSFWKQI